MLLLPVVLPTHHGHLPRGNQNNVAAPSVVSRLSMGTLIVLALGLLVVQYHHGNNEPYGNRASAASLGRPTSLADNKNWLPEHHPYHRQLFPQMSRQCSLGTELIQFRYNATSGRYSAVTPENPNSQKNDDEPDLDSAAATENSTTTVHTTSSTTTGNKNHTTRRMMMSTSGPEANQPTTVGSPSWSTPSSLLPLPDGTVLNMRTCWCAQVYFDRLVEYCPATFDSCVVVGTDGPVSCYQQSTASRSSSLSHPFWPVLLFWWVAWLYAVTCTEPGRAARDHVHRQGAYVWWQWQTVVVSPCRQYHASRRNRTSTSTTSAAAAASATESLDPATTAAGDSDQEQTTPLAYEDILLQQQVQRLMTQQPERAAIYYRHAILYARYRQREQRRQQRQLEQRRLWCIRYCSWYAHYFQRPLTDSGHAVGIEDELQYDRLMLKTRVFREEEEDEAVQLHPQQSSVMGTPMEQRPPDDSPEPTTPHAPTVHHHHHRHHSGWRLGRHHDVANEMDDDPDEITNHQGGVQCAICLARLENGEIIGDIPCRHVFHKECLKDWLKRKNKCPLCRERGLARLQHPRRRSCPMSGDSSSNSSRALDLAVAPAASRGIERPEQRAYRPDENVDDSTSGSRNSAS